MSRLAKFLIVALLAMYLPLPAYAFVPTQQNLSSVVQIYGQNEYDGQFEDVVSGSGYFISSDGTLMTNAHVVVEEDYTPYDRYVICLQSTMSSAPDCKYVARLLVADDDWDVAMLRLTDKDINGNSVNLSPSVITWGDSASLHIGDEVDMLGYPDVGGSTVTLTKGIVSGFTYNEDDATKVDWIKSDAKLNPGNSGGAAFDSMGRVIGMPTLVSYGTEKIGYIRPANLIKDWIVTANLKVGNEPVILKVVPSDVDYLSADAGDGEVTLYWDEAYSSDGIKHYEVVYDTESFDIDNSNMNAELMPNYFTTTETETTITDLTNDTTYYFWVRPVSGKGVPSVWWSYESDATPSVPGTDPGSIEQLFTDVDSTHHNFVALAYLKDNNIVSGYPDGTFRPEQTVNRAEMMKMLVMGLKEYADPSIYKNCFPDVREEWFAVYVCYAKEKGWINGYPDGKFKPGDLVNRAESIKMILNTYGIPLTFGNGRTGFADVPESSWFFSYVSTAENVALLEEKIELQPGKNVTRANVGENIFRAALMKETQIPASSGVWNTPTGGNVTQASYFPLEVGKTWTYNSVSNDNSNQSEWTKVPAMCDNRANCVTWEHSSGMSSKLQLSAERVSVLEQAYTEDSAPLKFEALPVAFTNRNHISFYKVIEPAENTIEVSGYNMSVLDGVNAFNFMGYEEVDTPLGKKMAVKVRKVELTRMQMVSMYDSTDIIHASVVVNQVQYLVENMGPVKIEVTSRMTTEGNEVDLGSSTSWLESYE